jgi:hypothetical protein
MCSSESVSLPLLTAWHLPSQDRLFAQLRQVWSDDTPRVMVDLGCHAAHGKYRNVSDALLWLHHFRSQNGGIVLGVDIIEDYSLDLQHRFDDVEPYRSMRGVSKRALTLAIGARDGVLEDHSPTAQLAYTCCLERWCRGQWSALEADSADDHYCRIPRQRAGAGSRRTVERRAAALPLPPSSHAAVDWAVSRHGNMLGKFNRSSYRVRSVRADTLWRRELGGRTIARTE